MKFNLITILLIFISFKLYSQNKMATINGLLKNKLFTYAYLYDSESKETKVSQIVSEQFKFVLKIEKDFKLNNLFLSADSLILPENEIKHRIQDPSGIRTIALENMNIYITDGVKSAVIEGGELNKALDEMNKSIKNLDHDSYFEKYPNSPVSVFFLKALVQISKHPMIGTSVNVQSFYGKLSDRIKNSDEGKLLYTSIFK